MNVIENVINILKDLLDKDGTGGISLKLEEESGGECVKGVASDMRGLDNCCRLSW